ncbi:MAG: hypothetical protein COA78_10450 [Blastopirellula sp.]|nr:MAG: hypothetical protein COA78_10450 [Blastopirellula sp.]
MNNGSKAVVAILCVLLCIFMVAGVGVAVVWNFNMQAREQAIREAKMQELKAIGAQLHAESSLEQAEAILEIEAQKVTLPASIESENLEIEIIEPDSEPAPTDLSPSM